MPNTRQIFDYPLGHLSFYDVYHFRPIKLRARLDFFQLFLFILYDKICLLLIFIFESECREELKIDGWSKFRERNLIFIKLFISER